MQNGPPPLPAGARAALHDEAARADLASLGLALDARAERRFAAYLALIEEWNERAGLTTVTNPVEVVRRHFGESLALLAVLRRAGVLAVGARVIDIGSGAGFPGLPMAIVDASLGLTLLESHARRADFLRTVLATLALPHVEVVQARAEDAGRDPALRGTFDAAVARAVAPLAVLVELALPLLHAGGVVATPKGARALAELAVAAGAIEALGGRAEAPLPLPLPPEAPPQLVLLARRVGDLDARYPRRAGIPAKRPLGGRPGAGGTIGRTPLRSTAEAPTSEEGRP